MTELAQKLEALLFVAGEAVSKAELAPLLEIEKDELEKYIQEVSEAFLGRGITLVSTKTHVQLTTAPEVGEYLAQFATEETEPLSRAAAETLAIIAYRGPLSRPDIDVLRGVDCRAMLRQLVRRGLVTRITAAGKQPLYDVNEDFLRHTGVAKREDLPRFEELSNHERIQQLLQNE